MAKERVSALFWNKFHSEAEPARYSPYMASLASDDISSECFSHSVSQELLLLQEFVKLYKFAETLVKNDYQSFCISQLRLSALQYIADHEQYIQEMGYKTIPNTVTEKYIDFLHTTVCEKAEEEQLAAYILAAIASSVSLSANIGDNMINFDVTRRDITPIYKKWIHNHAFIKTAAMEIENVLDELSGSLNIWKVKALEKVYYQALKLAVEFYSSLPVSQETIVPVCRMLKYNRRQLKIFCNFDTTCTVLDSCSMLQKLSIERTPKSERDQLRRGWSNRCNFYRWDFEISAMTDALPSGQVLAFNFELLRSILKHVAEMHKKENASIIESKLLKGLRLDDILCAGQNNLQDGCRSFFQRIAEYGSRDIDVNVISFCLCGDIIRSAFTSDLNVSSIYSNELLYEGSIATGQVVTKLASPMDKLSSFTEALKASDKTFFSVYIGGKSSDLLCLLEADLGIVVNPRPTIVHLCRICGIRLVPLSHGMLRWQRSLALGHSLHWGPSSGFIYYGTWAEVEAFFLGYKKSV